MHFLRQAGHNFTFLLICLKTHIALCYKYGKNLKITWFFIKKHMLLRTLEKSLKISVVKLVKLKIDSDTEYKSGVKKKIKEE